MVNEERTPIPADVVAKIHESHRGVMESAERLKRSAIAEGKTLLAVRCSDYMHTVEELDQTFEKILEEAEIVDNGAGISSDPIIDAFIQKAKEQYGSRGKKQALEILQGLEDGIEPDDYPVVRDALIEAFWDAKAYNQRYANKKYRQSVVAD